MQRNTTLAALIVILILASAIRLWGLSRGDMLNDEVLYAFRAIGLVDYFNEPTQTTPLQWFDPAPPRWTKISFHDHPPLVFLVQHAFIKAFGENAIAFRLPSVILGILSVYLVYLLGRRLFANGAGLIAASLAAVTLSQVFISRVGMQEAYVIFFILLASLLFLKALENEKYFILTGTVLGLAILTKYTAFVLVPVFVLYLLFLKPGALLNKKLWLGALLALLLFSPAVIYNIELYRAAGHFDFQFSYLLRQHPAEWPVAPGRQEVGSLGDRVRDFVPNLIESNSWVFLSLFGLSLFAFAAALIRAPRESFRKYGFLAITIFGLVLLLLLVGPTHRFLTTLAPFMAISAAVFLWRFYSGFFAGRALFFTAAAFLLFVAVLGFEIFYSYNNQLAYYPKGPEPWLASKIRYENYNLGYRELGEFLDDELEGKFPGVAFEAEYSFLAEIQDRAIERARKEGFEPYRAMFVYYDNFDLGPRLWALDRRLVYHGWPVMNFNEYLKIVNENGSAYFAASGVETMYFIQRTNIVPVPEFLSAARGAEPIGIYNKKGDEAFLVYKASPEQ